MHFYTFRPVQERLLDPPLSLMNKNRVEIIRGISIIEKKISMIIVNLKWLKNFVKRQNSIHRKRYLNFFNPKVKKGTATTSNNNYYNSNKIIIIITIELYLNALTFLKQ